MRKTLLLAIAILFTGIVMAQTRSITGKVIDDKGNPVPFATVKVKDSKSGVSADAKGEFKIDANGKVTLIVSSVGFDEKNFVVTGNSLTAALVPVANIEEVVVTTALNIKRKADNLSYAQQGISGEKLTSTRLTDVNNALAGKIAGVQVLSQSGAKLGSTGAIRLRGVSGGFGDVSPLYVLDGTPMNSNDINPEDIEDIQVLKGPAATALYGQRAEGGVIMVTTKKGKKQSGLGVDVTSSVVVDKMGLIPRYQNDYAGGSWLGAGTAGSELQKFTWDASMPADWQPLNGKYYHLYNDDASWGPRIAGQEYIPWYSWYAGTQYTGKTAKLTSQPDNIKDFWNGNGAVQFINTVSLSRASDNASFRLSYTNINQNGLIPTTSRVKNYISSNITYDINKHFTAGMNINYTNEILKGEFSDTYGNNASGSFSQWFHRELDMSKLKEFRGYKTPEGVLPSWNLSDGNGINGKVGTDASAFLRPNYWFDPYSYFDNISNVTNRNRLVGDINLTYKISNHFKIAGFIRKNLVTSNNEGKVPLVLEMSNDASSSLANSATSASRPIKSTYSTQYTSSTEDNYEFLASYNQKFGDFNIDLNAGANDLITESKSIFNSTKGGLTIPNLFTLSNSVNPISYSNSRSRYERRSFYGRGTVNWKDFAIVDFSVRNDISSSLPTDNNSYIYPSAGLSLLLTKYVSPAIKAISFLKVRGSYAQVGTDLGAYALNPVYTLNSSLWGTNALTTTPDGTVDANIRPTLSSSYELGLDARFLKNRIGLSFTYYNQSSKDQLMSTAIPGASGFSSKLINAGQIDKNGIEVTIDATPVVSKDFKWNISLNFAHNTQTVVAITPDIHSLYKGGGDYSSSTGAAAAAPGVWQFDATSPYGNKYAQLIGIGIQKYNGTPVLAADGQYVPTASNVSFGSTIPDFTGGMINSFNYKNFTFSFTIDFSKGGVYYSLSDMWGKYSGLYDVTAGLNDKGNPIRNNVADGGGVHVVGVDASSAHNVIDKYVDAGTYYHQFYNRRINENSVFDLDFVKVREASLSYQLPVNKMGKFGKGFKSINLSAICRNPFLIYNANKSIDPSELVGNYGESGQLPPTRSLGVTLKLGF
jgi:TonB-linked SusC/RagA family outer membrane protein